MINTTKQDQVTNAIRWFNELSSASLEDAGGKGANLGEMTRAGLPVPPGFVITANVYRALLSINGLDERIAARLHGLDYQDVSAVSTASRDISRWIKEAEFPQAIEMEIRQAYTRLSLLMGNLDDTLAVAVRSSATAEDLPNASFAGQQETFLNICSPEAVLEAVQKCWASLWTPQAMTYRNSMDFEQLRVALAVVIQAMVPADVAGVMFTANPVTGNRAEILISASYGLGESVVSGSVTPDTFIVSEHGEVRERSLGAKETRIAPNGCGTHTLSVSEPERSRFSLEDADLAALAAMAKRIQTHYGAPQDTEWAISRGELYLLQARPITTLKDQAHSATAEDTSIPQEQPLMAKAPRGIENTIDHIPEPPMPLDLAMIGNNSFNLFFEKLGFRPPAEPIAQIERSDGRVGLRLPEPRLSPAILWKLPAHLAYVLRTDPMRHWQPLSEEMASWLKSIETRREAITDPIQLTQLMTNSYTAFEFLFARRFLAAMIPGLLYGGLVGYWVRQAVGKADAAEVADRLYRATPYKTALQNQAMTDLARLERQSGKDSAAFQTAFEHFLDQWGNRPVRGMIALPSSPTWSEQPEIAAQMVEALLSGPGEVEDSAQAQLKQAAEYRAARAEVERRLNPLFRRWFRLHLERARQALVVREEGLSYAEDYNAFLRRAVLQLGNLLVEAGKLEQPEDIFYLLFSELEPAARGRLAYIPQRIARRKRGYQKLLVANARGQHWLYATGSMPEPKAAPASQNANANILKGIAASQGEVIGRVRVIHGPEEFGQMRKGEILVAPFTAPAWTPLFSLASAVVTDIGSLASHAAIVAREYGIPCVVAVSGATRCLRDGQLVQVNGTQGTVTILDSAA